MATSPQLTWSDVGSTAPKPPKLQTKPRAIQDTLNDERPKILLPGDNRLLSDVAEDCGRFLGNRFFYRNGEVLAVEDGEVRRITEQQFRTETERYVVFCRQKRTNDGSILVDATMYESEARGIMAATQFTEKLRRLVRIHAPRLPILRGDGSIELLPEGYDRETGILTIGTSPFPEDMTLIEGRAVFDDLLSEFDFADGERSKAVSIAALLGMIGTGLMPTGSLKPGIVLTKNAEGAGATTLACCIVWPLLGNAPIRTLPEDDAEMRKILLAAARDAQTALLFDNVKGVIGGAALEAFVSSAVVEGRLLGTNQSITCPNTATVILTANGARVTPDMRRRSLFIELHLGVERAEDRQFRRPISAPVLTEMRPRILAAAWALIRHWDSVGRPAPSRSHSAFPEWAQTIGGIVEASGFTCPFETARVVEAVDEDAAGMRSMVAAMQPGRKYENRDLIGLCRTLEIFPGIVADEMTPSQRSIWGKVLSRFDRRTVEESRFFIEGTGHGRRFWVTKIQDNLHGRMVEHGLPHSPNKNRVPPLAKVKTMYDHATMHPDVVAGAGSALEGEL